MQFLVFNLQSFKISKHLAISFLMLFFASKISYAQYKIPEKPKFQTSVYDYINLLSATQKNDLEQKLIKYSDTTSTQIVVAIINSTEGENINFLGAQWGQKWGIGGSKEEDNGILILLAINDRKIGVNTGYGVEHLLTDALSKRIIENDILPYFKQNDYYGGLTNGTEAIFEVLKGSYQGSRKASQNKLPIDFILILIFIFIIILIAISKNKRNGGNRGSKQDGFDIWDAIILSNLGRGHYGNGSGSNWGGGSSSGGGFGGGFGGGGFGGGGSSGGW